MKQTAALMLGILGLEAIFVQLNEIMKSLIDLLRFINTYTDRNTDTDNMSGKVWKKLDI